MKRCRLVLPAIVGLAVAALAPAQSPFAPPATLQVPVPASAAERVLVAPQPALVPVDDPYQPRLLDRPPAPTTPGGPLFGLQLAVVRPSLGGYIAAGPLNTAVPLTVMLGWQFPSCRAVIFEYLYFGSNADRTTQFPNDPGPVVTHRHIEGHVVNLDVRFLEGGWEFLKTQTELGLKAANISYRAERPSTNYPSLVVNRFQGLGPHLDYKVALAVYETGLEFFVRSDTGLLFGKNHGFSQAPLPPFIGPRVDYPNNGDAIAFTSRLQLGASYWFRMGYSRVAVSGGYEIDGYLFKTGGEFVGFGGGPLGLFPFSFQPAYVTLANKGLFVRMEVKY